MSTQSLVLVPRPSLEELADLAVVAMPAKTSRNSYRSYLRKFLLWTNGRKLTRETIAAYIASLRDRGSSDSVIFQTMKAIRVLVREARLRYLISEADVQAIKEIHVKYPTGNHSGNWISLADVQALIQLPDRTTRKGKRDAAALGILVGCGLRRMEATLLTWEHYQTREGRKVLLDIVGKGGKIRTVPVPSWVAADLDAWRPHCRRSTIISLRDYQLWVIVKKYVAMLSQIPGHEHCAGVSAHDLRRTLAKLMYKSGVELAQISVTLGHSNLITTQRYLGVELELRDGKAGVDKIHVVPPAASA